MFELNGIFLVILLIRLLISLLVGMLIVLLKATKIILLIKVFFHFKTQMLN